MNRCTIDLASSGTVEISRCGGFYARASRARAGADPAFAVDAAGRRALLRVRTHGRARQIQAAATGPAGQGDESAYRRRLSTLDEALKATLQRHGV
jgi:hypothetical protein